MSNEKSAKTTMGYFWAAREMLTPTLKKTAFLEKGVLTPEEFVRAGDELVYRCPTWSWEYPTNPSKRKSYLPPDKQFLITRNVPCRDRVATLEQTLDVSSCCADNDGEDEDWMVSSLPTRKIQGTNSIEDEFDVLDEDGEVVEKKPRPQDTRVEQQQSDHHPTKDENEDEYADMADFEDENVIMDHDVAAAGAVNEHDYNDEDDGHIVKVRTYDLSITYDKYYQTPRIWLSGRSIHGDPLTAEETMEDVMTDYAHKTVTMEAHPFLSGPHASIHPCQHGKVMKTIVRNLMAASATDDEDVDKPNGPSVEMYLFIFLKFVSSIIPTINYDFTMDVTADTTKK